MNSEELSQPKSIQFQLIPVSENPKKKAIGEVIERKLQEGVILSIGRQVIKDGQPVIKGSKQASEDNIWFNSKVVSRIHAELWMKDYQIYIRDIGSSSGTFLNKMRLSPSGKESRPYAITQGDILQFGIDFKGKDEDIFKGIIVKIGFHDQSWIRASRNQANHIQFRSALKSLLSATNPYSSVKTTESPSEDGENSTDCCICIGPIAPFQALFVAPCSHCFHFKCVSQLITASPMFQCPLCRQVANLTASVSTESLVEDVDHKNNPDSAHTNPENETESPQSNQDNEFEHLDEDAKDLVDKVIDGHQRSKTAEAKRSSLTIKLAEILGRPTHQANGNRPDSANQKIDLSGTERRILPRLTPRSETPHFAKPVTPEIDMMGSAESFS